jgi:hypothetical protein
MMEHPFEIIIVSSKCCKRKMWVWLPHHRHPVSLFLMQQFHDSRDFLL